MALDVRPARPDEHVAALTLAFQHLEQPQQLQKIWVAQEMIERGELDPQGIWIAIDGTGIAGCMIAIAIHRAAVIWPPRCRISSIEPAIIENKLVHCVVEHLQKTGNRIAHCLLMPEEESSGESLLRNGFQLVTRLLYLRHYLELSADELAKAETLTYCTASEANVTELETVVSATYVDSQDCPELNHVRSAADFLASHRTAKEHDPKLWWIAFNEDEPVGVILLNQTESDTFDLAYLGVVPHARKRGIGRELVRKALFEAKAAGMLSVTLALDQRNELARNLYYRAGFELFDERVVFLRSLGRSSFFRHSTQKKAMS
jgi:mycothiol synthase